MLGNQIYLTPQTFNGGMPTDTMSRMLLAASNQGLRTQVYNASYEAALEAGAPANIAALRAMHASSPYQIGLKYMGTPLPVDAERLLEQTIVNVALRTRNAVNDLVSRGKVRALPDIGVITDQWKEISNQDPASVSMELAGGPTDQRQTFTTAGTPIPIIQQKFSFELRELLGAARSGTPLDTTHAARAAQMVAEAEENLLINGKTLNVGGYSFYGYRTHPQRQTQTGADFGTVSNVLVTFNNCMDKLRQANKFGQTIFYVAPTQFAQMLVDHKAESDKTALQRVLELPGVADVKYNPFVPDGEMVGVVMDNEDVDLAIAQNVTSVPWETEGGAIQHWRVFSSLAPRLKKDAANQIGIVHATSI